MAKRRLLHVEGHVFTVTEGNGRPGVYHFEWTSGAHRPKYGFSSASSDGSAMSEERMRVAIVSFLSEINPQTGYLN
jgi:hypothetical protein